MNTRSHLYVGNSQSEILQAVLKNVNENDKSGFRVNMIVFHSPQAASPTHSADVHVSWDD